MFQNITLKDKIPTLITHPRVTTYIYYKISNKPFIFKKLPERRRFFYPNNAALKIISRDLFLFETNSHYNAKKKLKNKLKGKSDV